MSSEDSPASRPDGHGTPPSAPRGNGSSPPSAPSVFRALTLDSVNTHTQSPGSRPVEHPTHPTQLQTQPSLQNQQLQQQQQQHQQHLHHQQRHAGQKQNTFKVQHVRRGSGTSSTPPTPGLPFRTAPSAAPATANSNTGYGSGSGSGSGSGGNANDNGRHARGGSRGHHGTSAFTSAVPPLSSPESGGLSVSRTPPGLPVAPPPVQVPSSPLQALFAHSTSPGGHHGRDPNSRDPSAVMSPLALHSDERHQQASASVNAATKAEATATAAAAVGGGGQHDGGAAPGDSGSAQNDAPGGEFGSDLDLNSGQGDSLRRSTLSPPPVQGATTQDQQQQTASSSGAGAGAGAGVGGDAAHGAGGGAQVQATAGESRIAEDLINHVLTFVHAQSQSNATTPTAGGGPGVRGFGSPAANVNPAAAADWSEGRSAGAQAASLGLRREVTDSGSFEPLTPAVASAGARSPGQGGLFAVGADDDAHSMQGTVFGASVTSMSWRYNSAQTPVARAPQEHGLSPPTQEGAANAVGVVPTGGYFLDSDGDAAMPRLGSRQSSLAPASQHPQQSQATDSHVLDLVERWLHQTRQQIAAAGAGTPAHATSLPPVVGTPPNLGRDVGLPSQHSNQRSVDYRYWQQCEAWDPRSPEATAPAVWPQNPHGGQGGASPTQGRVQGQTARHATVAPPPALQVATAPEAPEPPQATAPSQQKRASASSMPGCTAGASTSTSAAPLAPTSAALTPPDVAARRSDENDGTNNDDDEEAATGGGQGEVPIENRGEGASLSPADRNLGSTFNSLAIDAGTPTSMSTSQIVHGPSGAAAVGMYALSSHPPLAPASASWQALSPGGSVAPDAPPALALGTPPDSASPLRLDASTPMSGVPHGSPGFFSTRDSLAGSRYSSLAASCFGSPGHAAPIGAPPTQQHHQSHATHDNVGGTAIPTMGHSSGGGPQHPQYQHHHHHHVGGTGPGESPRSIMSAGGVGRGSSPPHLPAGPSSAGLRAHRSQQNQQNQHQQNQQTQFRDAHAGLGLGDGGLEGPQQLSASGRSQGRAQPRDGGVHLDDPAMPSPGDIGRPHRTGRRLSLGVPAVFAESRSNGDDDDDDDDDAPLGKDGFPRVSSTLSFGRNDDARPTDRKPHQHASPVSSPSPPVATQGRQGGHREERDLSPESGLIGALGLDGEGEHPMLDSPPQYREHTLALDSIAAAPPSVIHHGAGTATPSDLDTLTESPAHAMPREFPRRGGSSRGRGLVAMEGRLTGAGNGGGTADTTPESERRSRSRSTGSGGSGGGRGDNIVPMPVLQVSPPSRGSFAASPPMVHIRPLSGASSPQAGASRTSFLLAPPSHDPVSQQWLTPPPQPPAPPLASSTSIATGRHASAQLLHSLVLTSVPSSPHHGHTAEYGGSHTHHSSHAYHHAGGGGGGHGHHGIPNGNPALLNSLATQGTFAGGASLTSHPGMNASVFGASVFGGNQSVMGMSTTSLSAVGSMRVAPGAPAQHGLSPPRLNQMDGRSNALVGAAMNSLALDGPGTLGSPGLGFGGPASPSFSNHPGETAPAPFGSPQHLGAGGGGSFRHGSLGSFHHHPTYHGEAAGGAGGGGGGGAGLLQFYSGAVSPAASLTASMVSMFPVDNRSRRQSLSAAPREVSLMPVPGVSSALGSIAGLRSPTAGSSRSLRASSTSPPHVRFPPDHSAAARAGGSAASPTHHPNTHASAGRNAHVSVSHHRHPLPHYAAVPSPTQSHPGSAADGTASGSGTGTGTGTGTGSGTGSGYPIFGARGRSPASSWRPQYQTDYAPAAPMAAFGSRSTSGRSRDAFGEAMTPGSAAGAVGGGEFIFTSNEHTPSGGGGGNMLGMSQAGASLSGFNDSLRSTFRAVPLQIPAGTALQTPAGSFLQPLPGGGFLLTSPSAQSPVSTLATVHGVPSDGLVPPGQGRTSFVLLDGSGNLSHPGYSPLPQDSAETRNAGGGSAAAGDGARGATSTPPRASTSWVQRNSATASPSAVRTRRNDNDHDHHVAFAEPESAQHRSARTAVLGGAAAGVGGGGAGSALQQNVSGSAMLHPINGRYDANAYHHASPSLSHMTASPPPPLGAVHPTILSTVGSLGVISAVTGTTAEPAALSRALSGTRSGGDRILGERRLLSAFAGLQGPTQTNASTPVSRSQSQRHIGAGGAVAGAAERLSAEVRMKAQSSGTAAALPTFEPRFEESESSKQNTDNLIELAPVDTDVENHDRGAQHETGTEQDTAPTTAFNATAETLEALISRRKTRAETHEIAAPLEVLESRLDDKNNHGAVFPLPLRRPVLDHAPAVDYQWLAAVEALEATPAAANSHDENDKHNGEGRQDLAGESGRGPAPHFAEETLRPDDARFDRCAPMSHVTLQVAEKATPMMRSLFHSLTPFDTKSQSSGRAFDGACRSDGMAVSLFKQKLRCHPHVIAAAGGRGELRHSLSVLSSMTNVSALNGAILDSQLAELAPSAEVAQQDDEKKGEAMKPTSSKRRRKLERQAAASRAIVSGDIATAALQEMYCYIAVVADAAVAIAREAGVGDDVPSPATFDATPCLLRPLDAFIDVEDKVEDDGTQATASKPQVPKSKSSSSPQKRNQTSNSSPDRARDDDDEADLPKVATEDTAEFSDKVPDSKRKNMNRRSSVSDAVRKGDRPVHLVTVFEQIPERFTVDLPTADAPPALVPLKQITSPESLRPKIRRPSRGRDAEQRLSIQSSEGAGASATDLPPPLADQPDQPASNEHVDEKKDSTPQQQQQEAGVAVSEVTERGEDVRVAVLVPEFFEYLWRHRIAGGAPEPTAVASVVRWVLLQMCRGLHTLHAEGLPHGNVTSENVFVFSRAGPASFATARTKISRAEVAFLADARAVSTQQNRGESGDTQMTQAEHKAAMEAARAALIAAVFTALHDHLSVKLGPFALTTPPAFASAVQNATDVASTCQRHLKLTSMDKGSHVDSDATAAGGAPTNVDGVLGIAQRIGSDVEHAASVVVSGAAHALGVDSAAFVEDPASASSTPPRLFETAQALDDDTSPIEDHPHFGAVASTTPMQTMLEGLATKLPLNTALLSLLRSSVSEAGAQGVSTTVCLTVLANDSCVSLNSALPPALPRSGVATGTLLHERSSAPSVEIAESPLASLSNQVRFLSETRLGVLGVDADGFLTFANDTAAALFDGPERSAAAAQLNQQRRHTSTALASEGETKEESVKEEFVSGVHVDELLMTGLSPPSRLSTGDGSEQQWLELLLSTFDCQSHSKCPTVPKPQKSSGEPGTPNNHSSPSKATPIAASSPSASDVPQWQALPPSQPRDMAQCSTSTPAVSSQRLRPVSTVLTLRRGGATVTVEVEATRVAHGSMADLELSPDVSSSPTPQCWTHANVVCFPSRTAASPATSATAVDPCVKQEGSSSAQDQDDSVGQEGSQRSGGANSTAVVLVIRDVSFHRSLHAFDALLANNRLIARYLPVPVITAVAPVPAMHGHGGLRAPITTVLPHPHLVQHGHTELNLPDHARDRSQQPAGSEIAHGQSHVSDVAATTATTAAGGPERIERGGNETQSDNGTFMSQSLTGAGQSMYAHVHPPNHGLTPPMGHAHASLLLDSLTSHPVSAPPALPLGLAAVPSQGDFHSHEHQTPLLAAAAGATVGSGGDATSGGSRFTESGMSLPPLASSPGRGRGGGPVGVVQPSSSPGGTPATAVLQQRGQGQQTGSSSSGLGGRQNSAEHQIDGAGGSGSGGAASGHYHVSGHHHHHHHAVDNHSFNTHATAGASMTSGTDIPSRSSSARGSLQGAQDLRSPPMGAARPSRNIDESRSDSTSHGQQQHQQHQQQQQQQQQVLTNVPRTSPGRGTSPSSSQGLPRVAVHHERSGTAAATMISTGNVAAVSAHAGPTAHVLQTHRPQQQPHQQSSGQSPGSQNQAQVGGSTPEPQSAPSPGLSPRAALRFPCEYPPARGEELALPLPSPNAPLVGFVSSPARSARHSFRDGWTSGAAAMDRHDEHNHNLQALQSLQAQQQQQQQQQDARRNTGGLSYAGVSATSIAEPAPRLVIAEMNDSASVLLRLRAASTIGHPVDLICDVSKVLLLMLDPTVAATVALCRRRAGDVFAARLAVGQCPSLPLSSTQPLLSPLTPGASERHLSDPPQSSGHASTVPGTSTYFNGRDGDKSQRPGPKQNTASTTTNATSTARPQNAVAPAVSVAVGTSVAAGVAVRGSRGAGGPPPSFGTGNRGSNPSGVGTNSSSGGAVSRSVAALSLQDKLRSIPSCSSSSSVNSSDDDDDDRDLSHHRAKTARPNSARRSRSSQSQQSQQSQSQTTQQSEASSSSVAGSSVGARDAASTHSSLVPPLPADPSQVALPEVYRHLQGSGRVQPPSATEDRALMGRDASSTSVKGRDGADTNGITGTSVNDNNGSSPNGADQNANVDRGHAPASSSTTFGPQENGNAAQPGGDDSAPGCIDTGGGSMSNGHHAALVSTTLIPPMFVNTSLPTCRLYLLPEAVDGNPHASTATAATALGGMPLVLGSNEVQDRGKMRGTMSCAYVVFDGHTAGEYDDGVRAGRMATPALMAIDETTATSKRRSTVIAATLRARSLFDDSDSSSSDTDSMSTDDDVDAGAARLSSGSHHRSSDRRVGTASISAVETAYHHAVVFQLSSSVWKTSAVLPVLLRTADVMAEKVRRLASRTRRGQAPSERPLSTTWYLPSGVGGGSSQLTTAAGSPSATPNAASTVMTTTGTPAPTTAEQTSRNGSGDEVLALVTRSRTVRPEMLCSHEVAVLHVNQSGVVVDARYVAGAVALIPSTNGGSHVRAVPVRTPLRQLINGVGDSGPSSIEVSSESQIGGNVSSPVVRDQHRRPGAQRPAVGRPLAAVFDAESSSHLLGVMDSFKRTGTFVQFSAPSTALSQSSIPSTSKAAALSSSLKGSPVAHATLPPGGVGVVSPPPTGHRHHMIDGSRDGVVTATSLLQSITGHDAVNDTTCLVHKDVPLRLRCGAGVTAADTTGSRVAAAVEAVSRQGRVDFFVSLATL